MSHATRVTIVGVPMDLGQIRRGVDMGPSAMRYANAIERLDKLGYDVKDLGDIPIGQALTSNQDEDVSVSNLQPVIEVARVLAHVVNDILKKNRFPLILGGDHSISIGTMAGIAKNYNNLGVIWYDAHGDMNTPETSPSGNIHGMPLATSLGFGHPKLTQLGGYRPKVKPEHVVLIGARDLDEGEKELIHQH